MRAIAVDEFKGEPRLLDVPKPLPKADQLLVKVAATAINPFDWKLADGILKDAMPTVFPLILGQDAAGTVEAVGDKVTRFKVDDRVFGQFFHQPVGEGTYAEYAVVSENGAIAILPPEIDFPTGAALPTAGMTALSMIETAGLAPGATLLIVGATGGVGSFATQLAAQAGLRVLATASAPADANRLKQLGAVKTYAARDEALATEVKRDYPDGIDGVIDLASGAEALAALAQVVKPGGSVLTTVFSADEKKLKDQGLKGGNFEVKANPDLLQRLTAKKLATPIEAIITLAQAPAAIARSRAGHSKGKTIIQVAQ
jgi:NADPH:quinone reductase-like Zn-dependent oxidoreductase